MPFQYQVLQRDRTQVRLLRLHLVKKGFVESIKERFSKKPTNTTTFGVSPTSNFNTYVAHLAEINAESISPTIECSMYIANLDEIPSQEFNALSYTWGSAAHTRVIIVNGEHFEVRENLWQFLRVAIHDPEIYRKPLWVDQICINQTSIAERNHQVGLMNRIYTEATQVFLWLGLPTMDSEYVLKAFAKSSYTNAPTWRTSKDDDDDRYFLSEFLCRPYWSRLWIVQEVLLAKSPIVICGNRKLPLDQFQSWIAGLWPESTSISKGPFRGMKFNNASSNGTTSNGTASNEVATISRPGVSSGYLPALHLLRTRRNPDLLTLRTLIPKFIHHECKERRDKIFGLLALLPDSEKIEVDYGMSLEKLLWQTSAKFDPPFDRISTQTLMETILPEYLELAYIDNRLLFWSACGEMPLHILLERRYTGRNRDIDDLWTEIWSSLEHGDSMYKWWVMGKNWSKHWKQALLDHFRLRRIFPSSNKPRWQLYCETGRRQPRLPCFKCAYFHCHEDGTASWIPRTWTDELYEKIYDEAYQKYLIDSKSWNYVEPGVHEHYICL